MKPLLVLLALTLISCKGADRSTGTAPEGAERTDKTAALETGANLMQSAAPLEKIGVYLVGFHPMKDRPDVQMESHHYCNQVNEDFAQCVLFSGNTGDANLHGIEYIISEKLFESLPAQEKQYWHPHNYEILSGTLVAPGLPDVAEKEFMRQKINSYGKTWHVWMTGVFQGQQDKLPFGPPHLAWSFNADGEAKPGLVEERDSRMGMNSGEKRRERNDLNEQAHPQEGVDALKSKFPQRKGAPAGVKPK